MAAAEASRLVVATADPPSHRTRRRGRGVVEEGRLAAGKSTAATCNGWIVFEATAAARIGVSAGPISIGGDYTHCETQKIYKYAEDGKMSYYWKGKRDGTRATQHQVSVKYP